MEKYIKWNIVVFLFVLTCAMACNYFDKPKSLVEKDDHNMPLPPDHPPFGPTQKIRGTVLRYGSNPQGDIDKLLLDANGDSIWLHFPPHTAMQLLNIAKLHSVITINYATKDDKMRMGEIQQVSNNKNEVVDIKTILPPPPLPGKEVIISSDKIEVRKDESGRVTAFILSNKLITLPPHTAEDLVPLITSAKSIRVKGIERGEGNGFVNSNGLPLVRPDEIIIDGITYLVR